MIPLVIYLAGISDALRVTLGVIAFAFFMSAPHIGEKEKKPRIWPYLVVLGMLFSLMSALYPNKQTWYGMVGIDRIIPASATATGVVR